MLRIETEDTLQIVSPRDSGTPDVQDIVAIQKIVLAFQEKAAEGQWASVASSSTYGELHGLTSLVEFCRCRWVIFRCSDSEYCLYITPLAKASKGKTAADFSEEAKELSNLLAKGVLDNGYKVGTNSPTSLGWLRPCESLIKEYGYDECARVAMSALDHDFWASNIRSPAKLKKHFDVLEVEANKATKPPGAKPGSVRDDATQTGIDKFFESQQDTERDPF